MSQGPEWYTELAQEQGAFDLVSPRGHVGHQERGPDAVGGAVSQDHAADREIDLDRDPIIFEPVAVREVRREQFRHLPEAIIEGTPEFLRVLDDLPVANFTDR